MEMKILSQRNPAWGEVRIGESTAKIKDYGCLITCLSMLSDWYHYYFDPEWMAENLMFTGSGLIIWKSITASILPMKFVYRYYKRDDAKIKSILVSQDNACILQVNSNHWVVLVGYSKVFGYKVADPYYGDVVYLARRGYKITGFAEVTKK